MIKFFKKIRENLLSEGKTGKYLKYALGEIILVMIGILLALQVNNWNQNRLESQTIKLYLQSLKQDLKQDIESFEFSIGSNVGRFYSLQNLLELSGESKLKLFENDEMLPESRSTNPISTGDLNADLARTFLNVSRHNQSLVNISTIEELKATGLFSKISNQDLKESINDYYAMIERFMGERQQEFVQKEHDRWINSLMKDGVYPLDISDVQDPLELIRNNPERVAIVKSLVRRARWISVSTNRAQNTAQNLIQLIDQELQKYE